MPVSEWYMGLDLGQSQDYTARAVVEAHRPELSPDPDARHPRDEYGRIIPPPVRYDRVHYAVRMLERLALATPYPQIVTHVKARLQHPAVKGARLVVDATGVGRPVIDMFRQAQLQPVPITITGGDNAHFADGCWRVPEKDLVSVVQVLLQQRRLQVAEDLPEAATLKRELLGFKVKVTLAANETFGAWREGEHDDLVLACAVALWFAEHGPKPPRVRHLGTVSYHDGQPITPGTYRNTDW